MPGAPTNPLRETTLTGEKEGEDRVAFQGGADLRAWKGAFILWSPEARDSAEIAGGRREHLVAGRRAGVGVGALAGTIATAVTVALALAGGSDLDRLATHILAFEGDSHVEWFEGNFQDYEEDKKRRLGEDSVMPKRIKYKQFSR